METYRLLKEHNIPCHFGITISEYNSLFVLEKYKQYKNQIKAVTFFHTGGIFLNGNNTHYHHESDWRIEAALTEIYKQYKVSTSGEMLTKLYVKAGIFFLKKKRQTNVIPCDVGYSSIHLMANGELLPCMYLPPIKKITEGFDLKNFHSPQAQNQLKEIKQNKCPHCWMSCYGPHNMMQSPFQTISIAFKKIE
jgi:sulfatase maturation enzyme AslB (radical SAM superfamily)